MTRIITAAASLLALAALTGVAAADTKTTKSFSGWQVECVERDKDKTKSCSMSQALVNKKDNKRVMSMIVRKPKDANVKVGLQVPLGADLTAGVALSIDGSEPVKIPYKICLAGGCLAEFDLTDDWSNVLGKSKACTATITGLKKETVPFKIDLKNFAEALAYFTEQSK